MSDNIHIDDDLVADVIRRVGQADPEAQKNMLLILQYLVGICGFLAGDYPGPAQERDELLEHLHAFMKHVADDRAAQREAAAATSEPAQG